MNSEEIRRRIPHRPPMLLIDEIVSSNDESIVCRKTFRADEFFFAGHFPDQPIVPGVIQCECCLQAGALMLANGANNGDAAAVLPVATRMDAVKFKRMVRPGDTVTIEVALKEQISNAYFMQGKLSVDGKLATRLEFACSLTDRAQTADSAGEG